MIRSFVATVRFLTALPIPGFQEEKNLQLWCFPIIGAVLGSLGVLVYFAAGLAFPELVARSLAIACLVPAYSAFHLDGLADAADGFYAGKDPESVLRIMRDPHVGSMGVIAVVLVISLKLVGAASLDPRTFVWALPATIMLGHGAMAAALAALPSEPESQAALFSRANLAALAAALAASLTAVVVTLQYKGLGAVGTAALISWAACARTKKRLGIVTGDVCGAIGQVVEAGAWIALTADLERILS